VIVGDAKQFLEGLQAIRGGIEVIPADQLDLASADLRKAEAVASAGGAE